MTSGPSAQDRPSPIFRKRRGPLIPTLIVVGALVAAFIFFAGIYADVLWYSQLGYLEVFIKQNVAQAVIFLAAALIMAASTYISLRLAYGSRPIYARDADVQDNLSRYQETIEPFRRLAMVAIPVLLGVFAGTAAASQWKQVLLFFNQVPYGQTDPQFGLDYSFYMITLPFLGFLIGFLISVVLVAGIAGLLTQYLYGGIRLEEKGVFISTASRIHIAVVAALFLLLQGAKYWLDRYNTLLSQDGLVPGALFTDVNAVIPTKAILAVAAIIVAVLFVIAAVTNRWRLPIVGTAMLVITAILASGVYPWVVQRFQVQPSPETQELQFIDRNIELTREAYGLDAIEVSSYDATTDAEPGALREDAETTANIRLLDPNLISDAFRQLQQFRPYYQFPETLNVDRYEIDGETRDAVISVRGLDTGNISGWFNNHVVYTHGYGVVAARASEIQPDGEPVFMESGIPSTGVLGDYEPRIYFGESSPEYSVVGAPEGADPIELDRPETGGAEGDARTTFDGDGGPDVGNFFNRLVYALQFQSTDLLLSDAVNEESQILYDRDPRERVEKVAPYLTVDSNVYPAVIDDRVKWIVEGYTTNSNFPYSTEQQLEDATTDSLTAGGAVLPPEPVNYIRNAVKATVDAYDGSVDLYAWDNEDPLLQAWQKIFPESIQPLSEISGELMSHVRYPEDMFKVQRELLTEYHVTDPADFYRANQVWAVPDEPTAVDNPDTPTIDESNIKQPPYYMSLQMPDQEEPSFSLTTNFIPAASQGESSRNVLYGYLAADSNAGSEAGVKAEGYGTLRLLELPTSRVVPGPGQAQNLFNSDPEVSQALNLLRQGASEVLNGNLLTLPVGGGILYVQPVYVQSTGETSYPTLQRVLVSFGEDIGFAPTLDEALDQLFGGDSGVDAEGADQPAEPEEPGQEDPADPAAPAEPGTEDQQSALQDALQRANEAIQAGQAALAEGDFAAYGAAQDALNAALQDAIEAEAQLSGEAPAAGVPTDGATAPEDGGAEPDPGAGEVPSEAP